MVVCMKEKNKENKITGIKKKILFVSFATIIVCLLYTSKNNACRSNRVKRGLYRDGNHSWNADCVGAFNILRLYFQKNKINICLDPMEIKSPHIVKVAA